ncbi:hypothetical protein [Kitasatospora sp. NPDC059327]|uniref:hypothetical protein n=1 Tax=Kitasatospora sp. NPDC059327 TaxID=3346803 RepID=UPI0036A983FA
MIVSKTLRHRTLSTTTNIYSHLTRQAAREAVDAIARLLDSAELALHPAQRTERPRNLIEQFRDHLAGRRRRARRERPAHAPTSLRPGRPPCGHQLRADLMLSKKVPMAP